MFCFFVQILSANDTPTYNLAMTNFVIGLLFTNISLEETTHLCIGILFQSKTCTDGSTNEHFHELITIIMPESLVLFDWVAIGSLVAPTLANIFLCYHEQVWLQYYLLEFEPVVYRTYVGNTFPLNQTREHKRFF